MENQFNFTETAFAKKFNYLKIVNLKFLLANDSTHISIGNTCFTFAFFRYWTYTGLLLISVALAGHFG